MKLWRYVHSVLLLLSCLGGVAPYTWLDDQQTIRFTVLDLAIRLQPLESILTGRTLDNFIVGLRVFLEGTLNVKPTTVYNLQVALGDQTQYGSIQTNDNNVFQLDEDPWITAEVQVLIEYEIEEEYRASGESDMEGRIRGLFQDQWSELLIVLQLLDRPVFNGVQMIELEATTDPDDSRLGPKVSSANPEVADEPPSLSLLVILVVVGIGLVVSLAIATPLFYNKRDRYRPRPRQSRTRTLTTSGSPDGEGTKSQSLQELEETDSFSTDFELPLETKGNVQRVYSEDKVLPLTVHGLRLQKVHSAEDKLQKTLSDLRNSVFRAKEQERSVSNTKLKPTVQANVSDLPPLVPTKTNDKSKTRSKKKKMMSKAKSTVNAGGKPVELKQIYIARDTRHGKCGHSVSTLTGGLRYSMDEEDNESLTFQVGSIDVKPPQPASRGTTLDDCASLLSTDDFGSIAGSLPAPQAKTKERILI